MIDPLSPRRLAATAAAAGALFVLLLLDVTYGGQLARLDAWATPRVAALGTSALGRALSFLAADGVVVAALAVAAVACWRWGRPRHGLVVLVAGGAGLVVTALVKLAVGRPRPSPLLVDDAFPSGHAFKAVFGFGLALLLALDAAGATGRRPRERLALGGWVVVALLVGVGRVLAGEHWPTDVLGGWALGVAFLAGALLVARTILRPEPVRNAAARVRDRDR